METQTRNQSLRIKEGRTELIVNHNGEDLTFIHPSYGPNDYANVGNSIEQAGLRRPTMAETASLVYTTFNSDDKYSKEIKDLMEKIWLWAFTGSLYIPRGVYIQDDPEIRNRMPFMEESDLVKRLEANDKNVRFVPFGFKTESMTSRELEKNPYVIALAGEEGASKLAEVADKHRNERPYIWSFETVDRPLTRVAVFLLGFQ